jgi:acyl-CoA dehydrogenase
MSRHQVNPLDTIAAFLDDAHAGIAARAAAFRTSALRRPDPEDDAAARTRAPELLREMAAAGLFDSVAAVDLRGICLTREALAGASSLADTLYAVQALTALPLVAAGSAAQKAAWLTRLLSGEAVGAFAMTEPGAGSDVAAIATTARRDGASWVLDGEKHLISNAGVADVYLVFAATPSEGDRRRISLFLVPADAPGLSFAGAQVTAAPHPLGRIRLDACRLPDDALVDEEGTGFTLGLATLDRLRPSVGAAACGMAGRALAAAIKHTTGRAQFGTTLASMPVVRDTLARMATDLDAARLLVYRAAHRADTVSGRNTLAAAMAKSFATEAAQRIVDDALQLCGGVGLLAGHPVEGLYRAVRGLRIYEGTTEIQRVAIARELLDDQG